MTWINLREGIADLFATAAPAIPIDPGLHLHRRRTSSWNWWRPPASVSSAPYVHEATPRPTRMCAHCGKTFESHHERARFCSPEHRRAALAKKLRTEREGEGWFRKQERGTRERDKRRRAA